MGPGVKTYREGIDWRNLHRCHKEARPPSAPSGQQTRRSQKESARTNNNNNDDSSSQNLPDRIYANGRWWYPSKEEAEDNDQADNSGQDVARPTSRSSSRRAKTSHGGSRYPMKNLDNATRVGLFNADEGQDSSAIQAEILDETFRQKQPKWDVMNNQRHVTMMQTRPFEQEEDPAKTGLHEYLLKIRHDINNQRCRTAPNRSQGI